MVASGTRIARTRTVRASVVLCFPLVMLVPACRSTAALASISGVATVIDGDTIQIHRQAIRLFGIDAPEGGQSCQLDGKAWRCGPAAANALADLVGRRTVTCQARDHDRYGRTVAVCSVGGQDLSAWLAREGWALAYRRYSMDYVADEDAARAAKRGLWRGTFIPPWEWRAQKRAASPPPAAGGDRGECRIKGNVSRSGDRIYHLPEDRDYARTRITPEKGERWFCSEADALAAGWRRPKQ